MKIPIIVGKSGYNTLGTIHCMVEKNSPFFLVLVSKSCFDPILLSPFVKKYKIVKTDEEAILYLLKKREDWIGSVIIPTSDKAASLLDYNYNKLINYYHFPNCNGQGIINKFMDKSVQIKYASDCGLNVPQTHMYTKGDTIPNGIIYPCLIKPKTSIKGRKGVLAPCYHQDDLLTAIHNSKNTTDFLIQQYIDKEYELLLIGCRFKGGQTWIPGVFKKKRWYMKGNDGSFGDISTEVETYFNQIPQVYDFLSKINYCGPFSVEFGVERGKPFFYEINLRNDGTSHYFHKAGIHIPHTWFENCISLTDSEPEQIGKMTYSFIDEFGDFINLKTTGLPLRTWFRDLKEASVYKYYVSYDIIPFLAMAPRRILASIYKMFKK